MGKNDFQSGGAWSLKLGIGVGKNGEGRYYLKSRGTVSPASPLGFDLPGLLYNLEQVSVAFG